MGLGWLHDQSLVDVWDDTTTGNSGLDKGIKLLITTDGKLQVAGSNALDLEVLAGVACELKHLSSQVLEDGSTVDCGCGSDSAAGADSALQESVNSSDWEL